MRTFTKLAASLLLVSVVLLPILCDLADEPDWREPQDIRNADDADPRLEEQRLGQPPGRRGKPFMNEFEDRRRINPDFLEHEEMMDRMHRRQRPMDDQADYEVTEDDIARLPHLRVIFDMYKSGKINKSHPLYRQLIGSIQHEKYSRMNDGKPDRPGAMPPGYPHDLHRERMMRNGQFGHNIPPNARRPSEDEMKRMREQQRKEFEKRKQDLPV